MWIVQSKMAVSVTFTTYLSPAFGSPPGTVATSLCVSAASGDMSRIDFPWPPDRGKTVGSTTVSTLFVLREMAVGPWFRTRRGLTLNPQSFGRLLTNPLYAGLIKVPEFGIFRCPARAPEA